MKSKFIKPKFLLNKLEGVLNPKSKLTNGPLEADSRAIFIWFFDFQVKKLSFHCFVIFCFC